MPIDIFKLGDEWEALRWTLVAISLLGASAYQMLESHPADTLRTVLKTIAISALAPLPLLSLWAGPTFALFALVLALGFGSLGDFYLSLKDDSIYFKRGLIAFLIGHIFYLIVMVPYIGTPSALQLAGMVVLAVISGGTCIWLTPKLGDYKVPVWAYMGVISAMALVALTMPNPLTGLGALLFVFSDAIIAINRFARPVPARGPIVWITYYVGQWLLGISLLLMLARPS